MREQLKMLKHHAHMCAKPGQIGPGIDDGDAFHADIPPLDGLEAVHRLDQGGFARTRRAANNDNIAFVHMCGAVFQEVVLDVPLVDSININHWMSPVPQSLERKSVE